MTHSATRPIGYMLKRYPRLSETFVLNEMRALERLGMELRVFSLLRPEENLAHPAVTELQAPVTYFPQTWSTKIPAVAKAHATMALSAPLRYLSAAGLTLWWCILSRHPFSVLKHFMRAGYMALACRRQQIPHLHAHFANAPTVVAHLVSVMCNIPFSFSTHAKDLYLTRQKIMRRRIRAASFVLTCTRHNLEYLRSFLPEHERHKIHLVYHGIDLAAFPFTTGDREAGAEPGGTAQVSPGLLSIPLVLSVGRLVPKKGLSDLISACHALHERGVAFRCTIVGEGPLRGALEAQIQKLGLEGIVTLPGAMAHDRLVSLYKEASLFALSPRIMENGDRDGIPNVLVEAMASGLPVVSTRVSGIPELIENDRTGVLVEPNDPSALANAVELLLGDRKKSQRLAVAARHRIEDSFECWKTAQAVQSLLQVGAN